MKKKLKMKVAILLTVVTMFSSFSIESFAKEIETENEEQITSNNDEKVIVEDEQKREANVKHFQLPDGSYEAVVYTDTVHRKDENGKWQDIDNRLYDKNTKGYISSDERIFFYKKINETTNNIFTLAEDGYSISVSYVDTEIKNTNAKLSNHGEKYVPDKNDSIDVQCSKIKEIDNTTTVEYKDVQKNVTLQYELTSDFVKENIILKNRCSDYEYDFKYNLTGLEAKLEEDGSISLYDATTGKDVYQIPAPYMYDSNGVISYDVMYELQKINTGEYELEIVASDEWINADERAFPVVIDPTIRTTPIVYDTYINSSAPSTNYGSSEQLWVSSGRTSYIRIGVLPALPEGAIIYSADLYTAFYYYDSVKSGSVTVGAFQVTKSWSEGQLTWNTAKTLANYGYSTTMLSSSALSGAVGATKTSPGWINFDITSAVKSWYNKSASNYGIALKYLGGSNSSVILKSHETERHHRAYITIGYTTEKEQIIEDGIYWFSSMATAGASGNKRVMDVTGNSSKINTEIQQWDSSNPSSDKYRAQLFYISYDGDGYYTIYTFSNPNYCLLKSGSKIVMGSDNTNLSKWSIRGNETSGYTITNYLGSSYAISVPSSTTNGETLEFLSMKTSTNVRSKWMINKFEGYVFSVVSDPGFLGSANNVSGHSFLVIENCSSKVIEVGYLKVLPEQKVTIGTAGNTSGSDASSSGEKFQGIFYNREAYQYHENDYYSTRYSLTIPINSSDLNIINTKYLKNDVYNNWDLLMDGGHNCSWFATQVWNAVSNWDISANLIGTINAPKVLAEKIDNYSWCETEIEIPYSSWYGYYEAGSFYYVVGSDGAYPTVDED